MIEKEALAQQFRDKLLALRGKHFSISEEAERDYNKQRCFVSVPWNKHIFHVTYEGVLYVNAHRVLQLASPGDSKATLSCCFLQLAEHLPYTMSFAFIQAIIFDDIEEVTP